MARYIFSRLVQAVFTMWIVVTLVFALIRLAGSPVDILAGEFASPEQVEALKQRFGLDKPLHVQYAMYLQGILRGDFGQSVTTREPAMKEVLQRAWASVQLGAVAMVFTLAMALPIGVYAAVYRGRRVDRIARAFGILGQAVPPFWLGILLIWLFAGQLRWLPAAGKSGPESFIMPVIVVSWYAVAGIMRLTRSSMLDVLDSEYIKLARIKGVPERAVIWKHGLKNASIPVITYGALIFVGLFMVGSVVAETIFTWPGVGRLVILQAVRFRDFPVVQAVVIFICFLYVIVNLLVDIVYSYLDPRIRRA